MRSWLALFLCLICSPALAGFHGGGITNAWNGNLVQSQPQSQYAIIDYAKLPSSSESVSGNPVDERTENANGFPASFTALGAASCEAAGSTPWTYWLQYPTVIAPVQFRCNGPAALISILRTAGRFLITPTEAVTDRIRAAEVVSLYLCRQHASLRNKLLAAIQFHRLSTQ